MTVNFPAFTSNPPQIHHQKTTFCTLFLSKPPAKTGKPVQKKILQKASPFRGGCSLGWGESQGVVIFFEGEAEGFDDEVVVVALGQAGDGDRADDACAGDVNWEAAAVGGVVGVREVVAVGEGAVGVLEGEADGIRAAMETGNDVGFTLHPAGVVRGAAERGVEERLVRLAEAADVDDDGLTAGDGQFAEAETEAPGRVVVEAGEEKISFLASDDGEVFGNSHGE